MGGALSKLNSGGGNSEKQVLLQQGTLAWMSGRCSFYDCLQSEKHRTSDSSSEFYKDNTAGKKIHFTKSKF